MLIYPVRYFMFSKRVNSRCSKIEVLTNLKTWSMGIYAMLLSHNLHDVNQKTA